MKFLSAVGWLNFFKQDPEILRKKSYKDEKESSEKDTDQNILDGLEGHPQSKRKYKVIPVSLGLGSLPSCSLMPAIPHFSFPFSHFFTRPFHCQRTSGGAWLCPNSRSWLTCGSFWSCWLPLPTPTSTRPPLWSVIHPSQGLSMPSWTPSISSTSSSVSSSSSTLTVRINLNSHSLPHLPSSEITLSPNLNRLQICTK